MVTVKKSFNTSCRQSCTEGGLQFIPSSDLTYILMLRGFSHRIIFWVYGKKGFHSASVSMDLKLTCFSLLNISQLH